MTKETFAGGMNVMASTYRQTLSTEMLDGYWRALAHISDEDMNRATTLALRECKFMPTPAEMLAFVTPAPDLTGEIAIAWNAVKKAVRRYDYTVSSIDFGATTNAALRAMGSWQWLCEQNEDAMVWRFKEFERFYRAFAENSPGAGFCGALPGWGNGKPGCDDVRISIDGKALPKALPPAAHPLADVIGELAARKDFNGRNGQAK